MKKGLLCLFFMGGISFSIRAQDATVLGLKADANATADVADKLDTSLSNWKKGLNFSLNANQGSLSNWSAGGEKFSISINAYLNLYSLLKRGKHTWDNTLDLAYGITQTSSLGRRKSNDRIDFTTKYGYALHPNIYATGLFNARTQFASGYAYPKDDMGKEIPTLTSKSFQPAYLLLSTGIDYRPLDSLSIFTSPLTGRWVVVSDPALGILYGVAPGKKVRSEKGAFLSANYRAAIGKTISYKTKLDLFSNYNSSPQNVDVFWTNVLTATITKYINVSLNIDMIYDDNTQNVDPEKGPAPQWLQLMGIGFAYRLSR